VAAHRLLKLADQAGLTIIEDDIFGDFEHEASPRLAAFDGLERVIHIGSFAKSLSAAARCGFIAARREWIDGLIDLKIATSFGSGRLSAELVFSVLKDGTYRKHMDGLRERLSRSMGLTGARLKSLGIEPWIEPRGGIFLWCQLPEGLDAADVARRALADNVVLAPGNAFSVAQSASRFLRFNVAQSTDPRVFKVLETAMRGFEHT
jgi:DNA-binding transcriptional MocR family regulator